MCVEPLTLSSTGTDIYIPRLDQTPPPRELKVSDPKVRDLSLLQLELVPTAVLYVKFFDESLNRELSSKQPMVPLSSVCRQQRSGPHHSFRLSRRSRPPSTTEYG